MTSDDGGIISQNVVLFCLLTIFLTKRYMSMCMKYVTTDEDRFNSLFLRIFLLSHISVTHLILQFLFKGFKRSNWMQASSQNTVLSLLNIYSVFGTFFPSYATIFIQFHQLTQQVRHHLGFQPVLHLCLFFPTCVLLI